MRRLGSEFEERYPDYFCWLCEMVCVDGRYTDEAYWVLAKTLWDTDFFWLIEMDENRAMDGLYLRNRYEHEGGTDGYNGPCTVLEVLIALADRIDMVLDEVDGEFRVPIYFWEMLDNLGLTKYTDGSIIGTESGYGYSLEKDDLERDDIDYILERWMNRKYDSDGYGGLFPLRNPKEDQRDVELWYQASAYIIERYF